MLKYIILLMLPGILACAHDQRTSTPVRTVESVDLNRYLGKWYQIAAIPQFFERMCVSDTVAEYSLVDGNQVKVFNYCTNKDGVVENATGRAKIVDTDSNAKLKVTFLKFGVWLYIAGGDYWVLDLDENYRWVVVGEPTRKYGWILARDPYLSNSDLVLISNKLKAQGYDTCKLLTARQNGGFQERKPLCEVVVK